MDRTSGLLSSNHLQVTDMLQNRQQAGTKLYDCYVCERPKAPYDVRRCTCHSAADRGPVLYYCYRTCSEPDCNCGAHPTCWEQHLPRLEKARSQHKAVDPLSDLFVDLVTYSEPNKDRHRDLHRQDAASRWFQVVYRDAGNGVLPSPFVQVTDRFRQLCNPSMLDDEFMVSQYPGFVSFIGDTSAGKSTLVKAMLLMAHIDFKGDHSKAGSRDGPDNISDAEDRRKFERLERDASSSGRFPVTRSSHIDNVIDPTSLGVNLYKDIPPPRSLKSEDNVQTPILFVDCEGFNASMAVTSSERSRSPTKKHSSRSSSAFRNSAHSTGAAVARGSLEVPQISSKQSTNDGTMTSPQSSRGIFMLQLFFRFLWLTVVL